MLFEVNLSIERGSIVAGVRFNYAAIDARNVGTCSASMTVPPGRIRERTIR